MLLDALDLMWLWAGHLHQGKPPRPDDVAIQLQIRLLPNSSV